MNQKLMVFQKREGQMAAMLQSDTQKNSLLQDKVRQQSKELADLKQKLQEMAAYSASENVTSL